MAVAFVTQRNDVPTAIIFTNQYYVGTVSCIFVATNPVTFSGFLANGILPIPNPVARSASFL